MNQMPSLRKAGSMRGNRGEAAGSQSRDEPSSGNKRSKSFLS